MLQKYGTYVFTYQGLQTGFEESLVNGGGIFLALREKLVS